MLTAQRRIAEFRGERKLGPNRRCSGGTQVRKVHGASTVIKMALAPGKRANAVTCT